MTFDFNKVKLIGHTMPVGELEDLGADDLIAYCARVSNPENQMNLETAERLIAYLKRKAHWSPFEMVSVTMEIQTPRDIARQILRHRSFSFQEFSQRYSDPTQDLGFAWREARLQDLTNRQSSIDLDPVNYIEDREVVDAWLVAQTEVLVAAKKAYDTAINLGIAKEVARTVLPEGLTMSRMYMQGSVRSWIHYCDLRIANGTQKEHRDVAIKALNELAKVFPSAFPT